MFGMACLWYVTLVLSPARYARGDGRRGARRTSSRYLATPCFPFTQCFPPCFEIEMWFSESPIHLPLGHLSFLYYCMPGMLGTRGTRGILGIRGIRGIWGIRYTRYTRYTRNTRYTRYARGGGRGLAVEASPCSHTNNFLLSFIQGFPFWQNNCTHHIMFRPNLYFIFVHSPSNVKSINYI